MDKRTELSIDLLCAGARKTLANLLSARSIEQCTAAAKALCRFSYVSGSERDAPRQHRRWVAALLSSNKKGALLLQRAPGANLEINSLPCPQVRARCGLGQSAGAAQRHFRSATMSPAGWSGVDAS